MSDEYPEHDKLSAIQSQSQAIHEFIEWLGSGEAGKNGEYLEIGYHDGNCTESYFEKTTDLVARFFEIDLKKLEEEKCKMLEECRKKT